MGERRLISTGSPFEKAAGYSRAVVDGDYVFVAGTLKSDPSISSFETKMAADRPWL